MSLLDLFYVLFGVSSHGPGWECYVWRDTLSLNQNDFSFVDWNSDLAPPGPNTIDGFQLLDESAPDREESFIPQEFRGLMQFRGDEVEDPYEMQVGMKVAVPDLPPGGRRLQYRQDQYGGRRRRRTRRRVYAWDATQYAKYADMTRLGYEVIKREHINNCPEPGGELVGKWRLGTCRKEGEGEGRFQYKCNSFNEEHGNPHGNFDNHDSIALDEVKLYDSTFIRGTESIPPMFTMPCVEGVDGDCCGCRGVSCPITAPPRYERTAADPRHSNEYYVMKAMVLHTTPEAVSDMVTSSMSVCHGWDGAVNVDHPCMSNGLGGNTYGTGDGESRGRRRTRRRAPLGWMDEYADALADSFGIR